MTLIREGRVRLNGSTRRDPETPVRLEKDHIEIGGRVVSAAPKAYFMLNKPRGVVTTASDEKDRQTVYSLLDQGLPWIAPVGRLDKASEGLLLLTNDSEWSAGVLAPETHLDKTYHVQIGSVADTELLEAIRRGVSTDEGDFLCAKSVCILRGGERNTWLEIVLDEGKNRHIRRMLAAFRVEVLRLVRVTVGPLVLGDLPKGAFRSLTAEEKQMLDNALHAASLNSRLTKAN